MNVVGYVRVSSVEQVESGMGLDIQRRTLRDYCHTSGHRLRAIRVDAGVSGANGLEKRLGLADALDDLRSGRAQGLLVARLDRLARDLIVQEQLLAEVRRLGGEALSCAPGEAAYLSDDPADPSRKFIRQVLGAVSEYEKAMVVLRMRLGRERKAASGGYAVGAPPYGWRAVDGELAPHKEEQKTLAAMRGMLLGGTSATAIAGWLNSEGIPARRGRWHPATVARALRRSPGAAELVSKH